ncbi:MAG: glutamate racemase, partial [Tissierellia bacterium]|nr:glutamate racemase [Tissierellia bacterium]
PRYEYYATDAPERLRRIGGNFLKKEIDNLYEIAIDNL